MDKREILGNFQIKEGKVEIIPYGSGHINHTFLVKTEEKPVYILQGINTTIFHDTQALMENILHVTDYLRAKIIAAGGEPERETLTVIPTKDGKHWYMDDEGKHWRVYSFIENAMTYDKVEDENIFYQSALAFGRFQAQLADYPADTLHETIPDFHNTPKRFMDFEQAVIEDRVHRAGEVEKEIAFLRKRREELSALTTMLQENKLPLRVTHNDTKLNNIMFDKDTKKGICIIDLDTVMPGLAAYDFGDAIRFGANTAAEDEPDWHKASLSLPLFAAYVKGFLEGCGGRLTREEIETLPMGAKIMTLECGMRFLTDYLQGDIYYKIRHRQHNLDRCRSQFALAADMEAKWDEMCSLCREI